ncbi:MAG: hypothetical protein LBI28_01470 [Treponema sp.]|jgi:hypothetical protein|nr:hypothetical protein [Treponema sp.]
MKKIFFIVILAAIIVNYGYSSEEDEFYGFYEFGRYIFDELYRLRELCVYDMSPSRTDDIRQYIIEEYGEHLLNIMNKIREDKLMNIENRLITEIVTIIDYETNNILSIINLEYNPHTMLDKFDMMIDLMMLTFIIKHYEPLVSNYNI